MNSQRYISTAHAAKARAHETDDLERREFSANIIAEISQSGSEGLSFARYTQLAMMHPQWGYYTRGNQIFGSAGDFITASEMGSTYAHCLAGRWQELAADFRRSNQPFEILEIGPGSASMAELILSLAQFDPLPSRYMLYEPSECLRTGQRLRLERLVSELNGKTELVWLNELQDARVNGIVFANEVADVLPVEICRRRQGCIEQLHVVSDEAGAGLLEYWRLAEDKLCDEMISLEQRLGRQFADGYRVELHTAYAKWMREVCATLGRGQLWICDYGYDEPEYYHPRRSSGTLQCYQRHNRHDDPLAQPGFTDISTCVNFDSLHALGLENGMNLSEYQTQGRWLVNAGALDYAQARLERATDSLERHRLRQEILQLISPEAMGEIFKMMIFDCSAGGSSHG